MIKNLGQNLSRGNTDIWEIDLMRDERLFPFWAKNEPTSYSTKYKLERDRSISRCRFKKA